jgi:hypothetical protein
MRSATCVSHSAAGVLGRWEYAAVLTVSKPSSRTTFTLFWNCSSVSPAQGGLSEGVSHLNLSATNGRSNMRMNHEALELSTLFPRSETCDTMLLGSSRSLTYHRHMYRMAACVPSHWDQPSKGQPGQVLKEEASNHNAKRRFLQPPPHAIVNRSRIY